MDTQNRRISLDQISIKTPCPADWSAMTGDDQKRFCSHCNMHVHNLSAMTRSAAEELVCNSAGRLCVMYQPDAQGQPITLDYAPIVPPKWWSRWAPLAILVSITSSALAWAGLTENQPNPQIMGKIAPIVQPNPNTIKGEMIMGDIALPPATQPTTQPTTQPSE